MQTKLKTLPTDKTSQTSWIPSVPFQWSKSSQLSNFDENIFLRQTDTEASPLKSCWMAKMAILIPEWENEPLVSHWSPTLSWPSELMHQCCSLYPRAFITWYDASQQAHHTIMCLWYPRKMLRRRVTLAGCVRPPRVWEGREDCVKLLGVSCGPRSQCHC